MEDDELNSQNIAEVVRRIVGPIMPVGDSGVDKLRLQNLETLNQVINHLCCDVFDVYNRNNSHYESSRMQAAKKARSGLESAAEYSDFEE